MRWIDTAPALAELISGLRDSETVAIDTEADSLHSYFDKVCLVQITAGGEDSIVDPLAPVDLVQLRPILEDRSRRKVLHGADYDLRILDRDFGLRIANIFDTMVAAQLLGLEGFGLAALLRKYFGVELDKKHQRADWSMRPLTDEMLRYAATDTHYLIELSEKLEAELRDKERWSWAEEEFARLEDIRWREPEPVVEGFRKLKKINRLSRRSLAVLDRLWNWREAQARAADKPPFRILQNETMIAISELMPSSASELASIRGFSPWHQRRSARPVLAMIDEARALGEEQLPEPVEIKAWNRDRDLERAVETLRSIRDEVARDLHIETSVLAPRHVLTAAAQMRPATPEELDAVPAMRRWQRELLGERFVAALRSGNAN